MRKCRYGLLIFLLLMSVNLSCSAFHTQIPITPLKDSELKAFFLKYLDETDYKLKQKMLITALSARPDTELGCHIVLYMPYAILTEFKSTDEYIQFCGVNVSNEKGARKVAAKIILAEAYIIAGSGEQALTIFNEIIGNPRLVRFHPLCRLLKLNTMNSDSESEKTFKQKELSEIEKYNSDYKFLVGLRRLGDEIALCNSIMRSSAERKKFDYVMQRPIDKMTLYANPITICEACLTADLMGLEAEDEIYMLKRITPLLNDDNDIPQGGRNWRTKFYGYLARIYLKSGNLEEAEKYAKMGLGFAMDVQRRELLEDILKQINSAKNKNK